MSADILGSSNLPFPGSEMLLCWIVMGKGHHQTIDKRLCLGGRRRKVGGFPAAGSHHRRADDKEIK